MNQIHDPVTHPSTAGVEHLDSAGCGCPEGNRAAAQLSRRTLLAGAGVLGAAAGLSKVFGNATTQYAYAGAGYDGDTVVVLSLRGGFDGLSAIAPVGDPNYLKARPNLGVPMSRAIKLTDMFGLHPALSPLKALWDDGKLAAVQAVGQTNPTRSHFAAMADMENAAPGSALRTGWLDRMIGLTSPETFSAVAVGTGSAPAAMLGPSPELAIKSVDTFTLMGAGTTIPISKWATALRALQEGAPAAVASGATSTLGALTTVGTLQTAGYTPANGAKYPSTDLGAALKDLAQMIKSGVGVRAATVDFGNWDMHVGLGKSDSGWMFTQLTELGQALAAFATDLGPKLDDVTLVTLSEFGRRVAENGSGGLDHGHGNVSLVLGGGVVGGRVHGRWPGLAAGDLVEGDLAGTTDYRTILAEILEKRAKLSASDVFPGLGSTRLDMFRAR